MRGRVFQKTPTPHFAGTPLNRLGAARRSTFSHKGRRKKLSPLSHFGKHMMASILQHCACRLTPVLIAFLIGL